MLSKVALEVVFDHFIRYIYTSICGDWALSHVKIMKAGRIHQTAGKTSYNNGVKETVR